MECKLGRCWVGREMGRENLMVRLLKAAQPKLKILCHNISLLPGGHHQVVHLIKAACLTIDRTGH